MQYRSRTMHARIETKVPLLDALPTSVRARLLSESITHRYETGQRLWTQGDRADGLTFVLTGRVRIVRVRGDRQTLIHLGEPGTTLGEVPFFSNQPYPATAIAAEPTTCIHIPRAALERVVANTPTVAWTLLERLAGRVDDLIVRLDQVAAESVETRLARFLLAREKVTERTTTALNAASRRPFTLGVTQVALAAELGTVREVVVRALRRLCDTGTIKAHGRGCYSITDHDSLREHLSGSRI